MVNKFIFILEKDKSHMTFVLSNLYKLEILANMAVCIDIFK